MHEQANEVQGARYSPTSIRATWGGTGSVEDASRALGCPYAGGLRGAGLTRLKTPAVGV